MENTEKNDEYAFGLIIDQFDGTLTEEGKKELAQWLASSPEKMKIYQGFCDLSKGLEDLNIRKNLDASGSWSVLSKKLDDSEPEVVLRTPRSGNMVRYAAAIVAIAAAGIYYQVYQAPETFSTAMNEQRSILLPDGSSIHLNGNTTIAFNKHKYAGHRTVSLQKGEAFFDVVHNDKNRFVVEMDEVHITDLGTSFNVARSADDINVVVSSGVVKIEGGKAHAEVILPAGMHGLYKTGSGAVSKSVNSNVNFKAWVDKKLTFNNTRLTDVASLLGKVYGCKVILAQPSLKDRILHAKLNYADADSAIQVIAQTLDLKVEKNGAQFLLADK
ncbi:FecR family protein [Hufsiella ginkgonis]|uniref:DUF4974 domain-containing protein n=1 Tax=Hufsiella ginkgonis TaxID=2695274 RepID=A0A7K1XW24_9SPHI|nr:FecR domain-containing protein [Hufsiella ginkgonis]MXV15170.1 hypothetical protein [Hufsiella ginkgonis]